MNDLYLTRTRLALMRMMAERMVVRDTDGTWRDETGRKVEDRVRELHQAGLSETRQRGGRDYAELTALGRDRLAGGEGGGTR